MQDLKMRDMKMRHHVAGVENAGKVSMESQRVKKCLKVVVFVCRVIPSVYVYLINDVKRNYTGIYLSCFGLLCHYSILYCFGR